MVKKPFAYKFSLFQGKRKEHHAQWINFSLIIPPAYWSFVEKTITIIAVNELYDRKVD
jgi:hypothetical protein